MKNTLSSLLSEYFDLGEPETVVLIALLQKPGTVRDIATRVKRARCTVQNALGILLRKELVIREARCCNARKGRFFFYHAISLSQLTQKVVEKMKEKEKKVLSLLEGFRTD